MQVYFNGGKNALKETQRKDLIKTNFAKDNGYNLIRIAYNENIEDKLSILIESEVLIQA